MGEGAEDDPEPTPPVKNAKPTLAHDRPHVAGERGEGGPGDRRRQMEGGSGGHLQSTTLNVWQIFQNLSNAWLALNQNARMLAPSLIL